MKTTKNAVLIIERPRWTDKFKPTLANVKPVCNDDLDEETGYTPGEREARNIVFAISGIAKLGSTNKMEAEVLRMMQPMIAQNAALLAALEAVVRVADRDTREFNQARAAIRSAKGNA